MHSVENRSAAIGCKRVSVNLATIMNDPDYPVVDADGEPMVVYENMMMQDGDFAADEQSGIQRRASSMTRDPSMMRRQSSLTYEQPRSASLDRATSHVSRRDSAATAHLPGESAADVKQQDSLIMPQGRSNFSTSSHTGLIPAQASRRGSQAFGDEQMLPLPPQPSGAYASCQ